MAYYEDKSKNGDKGIGKSSLKNHQEEEDYEVANESKNHQEEEEEDYEDTNRPSNGSGVSNSPGPGYKEPVSMRSGARFDHYNKPQSESSEIEDHPVKRVDFSLFKPNLKFAETKLAAREQYLDPISWEVDCMNRFSNEMFTKLAITEHRNESISPFSIQVVLLIMVALGVNLDARNEINKVLNSTTTTYLINHSNTVSCKDVLVLKSTHDGDYFKMVPGVFVDPSLMINIEDKIYANTYFKALIEKLSFKQNPDAQRRHINKLTCPETDHNISELFAEGSIDANTETVLASFVNFKLAWKRPFKMFHSRTFWNSGTTSVQVNMMYDNQDIYYYHDEYLSYAAIMLPFHVNEYSMIIILPDDKDGLKQFDFTKIDVYELLEINLKTAVVDLHLPSFKIDQPVDFKEILSTKFNCSAMFKKGLHFEDRDARINKFMHKTYVEVHSHGIGDSLDIQIVPPRKITNVTKTAVFNADHPFAYYIMYSFMGEKQDIREKKGIKVKPWMTRLILSGGVVTTIDPVKN